MVKTPLKYGFAFKGLRIMSIEKMNMIIYNGYVGRVTHNTGPDVKNTIGRGWGQKECSMAQITINTPNWFFNKYKIKKPELDVHAFNAWKARLCLGFH